MTVSLGILRFNNRVPRLQTSPHNFGILGPNSRGPLLFSGTLNNKDVLEGIFGKFSYLLP